MANQAGWFVLNNSRLRLKWNGGAQTDSVIIDYDGERSSWRPKTHFGYGIVTWNMPFLFRTSPGFNLLVRGPANCIKDGIAPLEGLVETDWAASTFTVNWKLTRRHVWVTFEQGEPLCMLVPQRRGELEECIPRIDSIDDAPELRDAYKLWSASRTQFNRELKDGTSPAAKARWQKDYFQGQLPDGSPVPEHQTRMHLQPFIRGDRI